RLARHDIGKPLLKRARNLAVQLLAAALEQALISRITHKRVLEAVHGLRRFSTAEHQLRLLELSECLSQCGLVASDQCAHQGVRELAPDGSTNLGDLPHRGEPVEPRHFKSSCLRAAEAAVRNRSQIRAYSITSSARASNAGATSRPRARAVFRLITSSYLVGDCTGRSPGFSPLRMRST